MVTFYICPVCGYGMEVPPSNYNICSSCGTEFEPSLSRADYLALRAAWVATGPSWWSAYNARPKQWDPMEQLRALNLNAIIIGGNQIATAFFYPAINGNNSTAPPISAHRQPRKGPVAVVGNANAWPGILADATT